MAAKHIDYPLTLEPPPISTSARTTILGRKAVADVYILQDSVSGIGNVYRFGGDEFIIVLSEGNHSTIEQIANHIKDKLGEAKIENINSNVLPEVTISQGYAYFVPSGDDNIETLIEHADHALYFVKNNGRNSYYIIEK